MYMCMCVCVWVREHLCVCMHVACVCMSVYICVRGSIALLKAKVALASASLQCCGLYWDSSTVWLGVGALSECGCFTRIEDGVEFVATWLTIVVGEGCWDTIVSFAMDPSTQTRA